MEALAPHMETLQATEDQNERMAALAYETYVMVEEMLFRIIDRKWMSEDSKLVLLGGIMINVDGQAADMFIPLNFEVLKGDGSVHDLMEKVFGELANKHTNETVPKRKCVKGQNLNEVINSNKCIPCKLTEECSHATTA